MPSSTQSRPVAVRGDPVVDRGAGTLGVEALTHQRGELRQRRQERRRIGGAAELLEHDRQLDRVLRVGQLRPARLDIGLPQRGRIDAVLGDAAHQRRRALFGHRVAHGLLPEPLISIELEQHSAPPGLSGRGENIILFGEPVVLLIALCNLRPGRWAPDQQRRSPARITLTREENTILAIEELRSTLAVCPLSPHPSVAPCARRARRTTEVRFGDHTQRRVEHTRHRRQRARLLRVEQGSAPQLPARAVLAAAASPTTRWTGTALPAASTPGAPAGPTSSTRDPIPTSSRSTCSSTAASTSRCFTR